VPHTFLTLLGHDDAAFRGLQAIPLVEPEGAQTVGLVVSEREPLPPLARALLEVAQRADIARVLERMLPEPTT
jgi:hypothetical protein